MTESINLKESRLRSVLKSLSYRVIGTITTSLLVWFVTGELSVALTIGALEPIVKMAVYYLHERAWQQVPRGSVRGLVRRNG